MGTTLAEARAVLRSKGKHFDWTLYGMDNSDLSSAVWYHEDDVLAYARACIADAVAPALEYVGKTIDMMKAFESSPVVRVDGMILCLERVRRLLTEGRE